MGILMFNRTAWNIGFRQEDATDDPVVWVAPSSTGTFWWTNHTNPQRMQVTVECCKSSSQTEWPWSPPFKIETHMIGAYPVVMRSSDGKPFYICLRVGKKTGTFSVTVCDSDKCHRLVNRHPGLILHAVPEELVVSDVEDPGLYNVFVRHGSSATFANSQPFKERRRLLLTLGSASPDGSSENIVIALDRTNTYCVAGLAAIVEVKLRSAIAMVTVRRATPDAERWRWDISGTFDMESFGVGFLLDGGAKREVFTVHVDGVQLAASQEPDLRCVVDFHTRSIQVDMWTFQGTVVMASVPQEKFLLARVQRDNTALLDIRVQDACLEIGELEVCLTDDVVNQVIQVVGEYIPNNTGISFSAVQARVGVPYHLSCGKPPRTRRKMFIERLEVSRIKVRIWCCIYLPGASFIPSWLVSMVHVTSFGANVLNMRGASFKLSEQELFNKERPGEGIVSTVVKQVQDHYLPHLKSSSHRLVWNSNLLLRGLLSKHFWAPREQNAVKPKMPISQALSNQLALKDNRSADALMWPS